MTVGWDGAGDFYEDDEPIEDVVAAFEAGEPVIIMPPDGQVLDGQQRIDRLREFTRRDPTWKEE